jgi:hypothetical protein
VSPRARSDEDFRDRMAGYQAECTVRKDLDPTLAPLDRSLNAATAALQRFPTANGAWLVSDGIWQVAAEFKNLMEKTYQLLDATGVLAMDPDEALRGCRSGWSTPRSARAGSPISGLPTQSGCSPSSG